MRFLLDANLSPRLGEALTAAGYQVRHVVDIGLVGSSDTEIFDRAAADPVCHVSCSASQLPLAAQGHARSDRSDHGDRSIPEPVMRLNGWYIS